MTVAPSIDPARFLEEHLAQASPDLGTCSLPSINTLLSADADAVCGADYRAVSDEEMDDFRSQNWRFVAAEPAVWSSLRDLSFGLLDGGDVHDDAVRSLLGVGGQRYVLGDQRLTSSLRGEHRRSQSSTPTHHSTSNPACSY